MKLNQITLNNFSNNNNNNITYSISNNSFLLLTSNNTLKLYNKSFQLLKQFTCNNLILNSFIYIQKNLYYNNIYIVILISSNLIRIFDNYGEIYDIPFNFIIKNIFCTNNGIIIECENNLNYNLYSNITNNSNYYLIYKPDSPYIPLINTFQENCEIITTCDNLVALSISNKIIINTIQTYEKDNNNTNNTTTTNNNNINNSNNNSNNSSTLSQLLHEKNSFSRQSNDSFNSSQNLSRSSPSFKSTTKKIKSKSSLSTTPPTSTSKNRISVSNPELISNVLGVPRNIENRSVSPLSLARIREIDHEQKNTKRNLSNLSTLSYLGDLSFSNSSDSHSISFALHQNEPIISQLTLEGVITLEENEILKSLTFSKSPNGNSLVHLLTTNHILYTYEILSQSIESTDDKKSFTLVRKLENIDHISHLYLGSSPKTIDSKVNFDIFGSIILPIESNIANLVIGISPPICQLELPEINESYGTFLNSSNAGFYKSSSINTFYKTQDESNETLSLINFPVNSWFNRRNQTPFLERSLIDKVMEVLLILSCDQQDNKMKGISLVSAATLSFLLQDDDQKNSLSRLILIFLLNPFLNQPNVPQDIVQKIINFLIPSHITETLPSYLRTIREYSCSNQTLTKFSLILFHIIHVGLEDLYIHENFDLISDVNLVKVSLYIFTSFLVPTYKQYYRNLIVFCNLSTSNLQTIDELCNQLCFCFEEVIHSNVNINTILSSSSNWISKLLKSTDENQPTIWSPFILNIKSIFHLFYSEQNDKFPKKNDYILQCINFHNLLAPSTTITRKFFLVLNQVIKWWKITKNENYDISIFAIAFISTDQSTNEFPEEILNLYPKILKITILQSLFYFRNNIDTLQNYCHEFYSSKIQHNGFCNFNEFGWSICSHICDNNNSSFRSINDEENTNKCNDNNLNCNCYFCSDIIHNQNECICHELKKYMNFNINYSNISTQILNLLGREDFIANRDFITPKLNSPYQVMDSCLLSTFPSLLQGFQLKEEEQTHGKNDSLWSESQFSNLNTLKNSLNTLDDSDGLVTVERKSLSRFSEDERMHEVCRLLRSTKTLYLKVERTPEMTDAIYRQKQQSKLLSLCRRALSCGVGRGMLTMNSISPLLAEQIPIPPIILSGRCPPTNASISLDLSTITPEMTLWPEYHNAVAAGLRIKRTGNITRNWILYNRINSLTGTTDPATSHLFSTENSHAGFLLSLGLQGHLNVLSVADICDYLTRGHEPTTISMLIGLAASRIGSSDSLLSKTLCLHLPTLMYPLDIASEIDVSPFVQTSALIGLGLLHCSSANRLIIEFLLTELASPTISSSNHLTSDGNPQQETSEAISLSAGWSLGMLLLRIGHFQTEKTTDFSKFDIHDLRVEDRLQQCIDGGVKYTDPNVYSQLKMKQHADASKSSRILEGNFINTNVTCQGAVIALTLMYLRTNNRDVASHIEVPPTTFALDNIRPDLLLFRAMGTCLILWNDVNPTSSWFQNKIPKILLDLFFERKIRSKEDKFETPELSLGTMTLRSAYQAFICILAGYSWGIALRFAGTYDSNAKSLLLKQLKFLQCLRDGVSPTLDLLEFAYYYQDWIDEHDLFKTLNKSQQQRHTRTRLKNLFSASNEKATRPTLEMCVTLTALSVSMVCAGSGDLDVLRVLRALHSKVDEVIYGTQMGIAMSIGLLFLAQGRASLKRDDISIAALIMSTCPRYPSRAKDNQSHLQVTRHLYVLAVEERFLQAIEVDSGISKPLDVEVLLKSGETIRMKIPNLLPELSSIKSIKSLSTSHLPAMISISSNNTNHENNENNNNEKSIQLNQQQNNYCNCNLNETSNSIFQQLQNQSILINNNNNDNNNNITNNHNNNHNHSHNNNNHGVILPTTLYLKKIPEVIPSKSSFVCLADNLIDLELKKLNSIYSNECIRWNYDDIIHSNIIRHLFYYYVKNWKTNLEIKNILKLIEIKIINEIYSNENQNNEKIEQILLINFQKLQLNEIKNELSLLNLSLNSIYEKGNLFTKLTTISFEN